MTTYYSVQKTKWSQNNPTENINTNEQTGKVRIAYALYEAAGEANGSVFEMFNLPNGARILEGTLTHDAMGGSTTLSVGHAAYTSSAGATVALDVDEYKAAPASTGITTVAIRKDLLMATDVSICSNALRRLGDSPITSLTDDTERARLCNSFFTDARDTVLRTHPWNFSITRASLAQLSEAPAYGFSYMYALPTNPYCLRVLEMEYPDYIFKIENDATNGRVLLTDESTANILYIAQITNTTLFDSMFVETLTSKLAVDLAYPRRIYRRYGFNNIYGF